MEGRRGSTAAIGKGWTSFGGLALFGLVVIVLCAGLSEMIGPLAAVPLVAQFFIWWATIAEDYSGPLPEQVLRITFRILGILAAIGAVLWIVDMVRTLFKGDGGSHAVASLALVGLGFAPPVVGGLCAGISPVVVVIVTLAAYLALALVFVTQGRHVPTLLLCISYLVLLLCYLVTQGNMSYLPPVEAANAMVLAFAGKPVTQLLGQLMVGLSSAFASVGTMVLRPLGELLMGIFESSLPYFELPELIGCVVGLACVVVTLSVVDAVGQAAAKR